MLIRLLNNQIQPYWEQLKKAITEGSQISNPTSETELTNILQAIYEGGLTCWISGGESGVNGIVLTSIMEDGAARTKSLVIYFAYRFNEVSKEDWLQAIEDLKKYAKMIKCSRIVAHPYDLEVVKLCEHLGASLTNYVVEWRVD